MIRTLDYSYHHWTIRKALSPWYEQSRKVRAVHGANSPSKVRIVHGTNSPRYEKTRYPYPPSATNVVALFRLLVIRFSIP